TPSAETRMAASHLFPVGRGFACPRARRRRRLAWWQGRLDRERRRNRKRGGDWKRCLTGRAADQLSLEIGRQLQAPFAVRAQNDLGHTHHQRVGRFQQTTPILSDVWLVVQSCSVGGRQMRWLWRGDKMTK